jgi:protein SCO1
MRATVLLMLLALASPAFAHDAHHSKEERLAKIGPAPEFALVSQDGKPVALADFRGKVVAVTFIYTSCADTCPMLTALMASVQDRLGRYFGTKVVFASITVDPERDTPEVLKRYAKTFGADLNGWAFLTGAPETLGGVARRYGVFAAKTPRGDVDHTFLTSIIDQRGFLRVQYVGARFNPDEFQRYLLALLKEQ